MGEHSCGPLVRRHVDVQAEPYKTTYVRSYFYENAVYHPFVHSRVKRKIGDERRIDDPLEIVIHESVNKTTFVPKDLEDSGHTDYYRRLGFRDTLKTLHEKYITDPPRVPGTSISTTGSAYVQEGKATEPKTLKRKSPIEEFTCSIPPHSREGYSCFPPTESGYTKYLDPYVTTSRFTHCAFNAEQQNGIAKKDIITFYDALGLPKNRGFGPKRMPPFGSYFHHDYVIPSRVVTKLTPSVPFFGTTSCYEDSYDLVPTNLMHRKEEVNFPAVWKCIEDPPSYCTEQCHVGTGWPVRASLDIGTVPGTR